MIGFVGVTPEEMEQVRPRLEAFAAEMLGGLARVHQGAKGELYLRGLMLDGKRKSMQPMAERLGVDHQQLQQFVTSSTWNYTDVRRRVAQWAEGFIRPEAYVVDDSGFPKDGIDSPGVARQYCGALGKTGNCQIGVSVHAVTDWASAAIDWRGCLCPRRGTTPLRPTRTWRWRFVGAGIGVRSRMRCGIGRSGGWRWTCSMRSSVPMWVPRRTPRPRMGGGWPTAGGGRRRSKPAVS